MFNLSRQEDEFYTLFIEDARLTYEAAKLLSKCFKDITNSESVIKQIKEMEHKGDFIVHEILFEDVANLVEGVVMKNA